MRIFCYFYVHILKYISCGGEDFDFIRVGFMTSCIVWEWINRFYTQSFVAKNVCNKPAWQPTATAVYQMSRLPALHYFSQFSTVVEINTATSHQLHPTVFANCEDIGFPARQSTTDTVVFIYFFLKHMQESPRFPFPLIPPDRSFLHDG